MSSSRVEIKANYLMASVSLMGILCKCNTCLEFIVCVKRKFKIFLINSRAGAMGTIRPQHDLITYLVGLWSNAVDATIPM